MKTRLTQQGFSAVEFLIILVVVGVIGLAGYMVYIRQNNKKSNTSTTSSQTSSSTGSSTPDVATAPNVSTTSDLDKASKVLDQTDPSASNSADSAQLDTQLANF